MEVGLGPDVGLEVGLGMVVGGMEVLVLLLPRHCSTHSSSAAWNSASSQLTHLI
jgi:hypothetical protein